MDRWPILQLSLYLYIPVLVQRLINKVVMIEEMKIIQEVNEMNFFVSWLIWLRLLPCLPKLEMDVESDMVPWLKRTQPLVHYFLTPTIKICFSWTRYLLWFCIYLPWLPCFCQQCFCSIREFKYRPDAKQMIDSYENYNYLIYTV